ncbi:MAG: amino acid permease, partial [Selenomonadaceae bacterium]|nr:amino acid permease [Selenomonadaceae bacterium]
FAKLSSRKVPMNGIFVSSGVTLFAVILNYLFPGQIFMYLMSIVIGAIVVTWTLIIITHIKFRKHCAAVGHKSKFPAILYPFANYLSLIFLAVVVCLMFTMKEMRLAVMLLPIWIILIWIFYKYNHRVK